MTTLKLRVPSPTPLTAADHDENMLRLFGFPTLAAMLADEDRDYTFYAAGATVITLAEGYRYEVAASSATDHHLITAADLKLYVLPGDDGTYNLGAFNPAGDDATDDHAVFKLAHKVAQGNVLHYKPANYYLSEPLENRHLIHVIGHGAKLRFPAGVTGMYNKHTWSFGDGGVHTKNITAANLLIYQTGLVKFEGDVYHPYIGGTSTVAGATLAATQPGTNPLVWTFLREEEGRDSTVNTWVSGSGTYPAMSYDPTHATYHTFIVGNYVVCSPSGDTFLVAENDAVDHDEETMYGRKLYNVAPEDSPLFDTGAGSIFEDFTLDGTSVTGAVASGFRMRSACRLRNLIIENFSEMGVNADAQVPQHSRFNPERWGNTNRFLVVDCTLRYNGDCGGLFRGSDGNAGLGYGIEAYGNGRLGIMDQSFLGNTYFGCRTYGNGNGVAAGNTGGRSSVVSHGGNLYQAKYGGTGQLGSEVSSAQLALYVATTPHPTNNQNVWMLMGEGEPSDEFPAWQSGQESGFYFYGGGYRSTSGNANTTWFGCTSGEDEGGGVWSGKVINLGGYQPYTNVGGQATGEDGGTLVAPSLRIINRSAAGNILVDVPETASTGNIFAFSSDEGTSAVWRLSLLLGDIRFSYINTNIPFKITGPDTALTFGTTTPLPHIFVANRGIIIGAGNNGRRHDTLTAAPATGEWARGDVIYNRAPSAGGNVGWICVTAGTPGTWKAYGTIAS